MESPYPFHPKGRDVAKDCFALKNNVEEHSKHPAQDAPDRNQDQQHGGLALLHSEHQLNMIFRGSAAYESKRKQKLTAWEINAIMLVTPKYLKWSDLPITFDRSDHPDNIPHP